MSISSGTYTVGGSGTNYPGTSGLDDAIADMVALTGALTIDIRGNVTLTRNIGINFANNTLTITSTENYHNGDPNSGYVISVNSNRYIRSIYYFGVTTSTCILENLNFYDSTSGHYIFVGAVATDGGLSSFNWIIRNCIFNKYNYHTCFGVAYATAKIETSKFYNAQMNCYCGLNEGYGASYIIENCSSYGTATSVIIRPWSSSAKFTDTTYKNNNLLGGVGISSTGTILVKPEGYKNSFIGSAPALFAPGYTAVENVIVGDEFKSVDVLSSDFLILKDDNVGVLSNSGIAPTNVTEDIKGYPIPFEGNYPVGCHVSLLGARRAKIMSIF